MARINSRAKGARVERQLRDVFREHGFTARRGQQFCGLGDSPDVVVDELPRILLECKGTEAKNFLDWFDQADRDAAPQNKIPIVAHKRKSHRWLAILPLEDLIDIIRKSDLVNQNLER